MAREYTDAEIAAWKAGDADRNERARREILRRDGARSPSENLAEGVALTSFAHRMLGAATRPRMPHTPLDPECLLRRLAAADVRHVLIGGMAGNVHGVIQSARTLALCPEPRRSNRERLTAALSELAASDVDVVVEELVRGGNFEVRTRHGTVDVIQRIAGVPGELAYAALAADAILAELGGVEVAVCSLSHLRAMMYAAGGPQDLLDLASLAIVRGEDETA